MNKTRVFTRKATALLLAVWMLLAQSPIARAEGEIAVNSDNWTLTNLHVENLNVSQVEEGGSFSAKLVPDGNYHLPASITVTGGTCSYSSSTGNFTVSGVSSGLNVTAAAEKNTVAWNLTHITPPAADGPVTDDGKYTLTADPGWELPSAVKVNGKDTALTDGTLDVSAMHENMTVTGSAVRTVTWNLTNISGGAVTEWSAGDLNATLAPETGYALPERGKISVKVGNAATDAFTYNKTTGAFVLPADAITGNVTITAEAVKTLSWNVTNITVTIDGNSITSPMEWPDNNKDIVAKLSAAENYRLPGEIKEVTVGGNKITGFTYDKNNGEFKMTREQFTGPVVITAAAVRVYTVTLDATPHPGEKTTSEQFTLDGGKSYAFYAEGETVTVSKRKGFQDKTSSTGTVYTLNVTANEVLLEEEDRAFSFTMGAENVTINHYWTASGKNYDLKEEPVSVNGKNWTKESTLQILPSGDATAVTDKNGDTINTLNLKEGENKYQIKLRFGSNYIRTQNVDLTIYRDTTGPVAPTVTDSSKTVSNDAGGTTRELYANIPAAGVTDDGVGLDGVYFVILNFKAKDLTAEIKNIISISDAQTRAEQLEDYLKTNGKTWTKSDAKTETTKYSDGWNYTFAKSVDRLGNTTYAASPTADGVFVDTDPPALGLELAEGTGVNEGAQKVDDSVYAAAGEISFVLTYSDTIAGGYAWEADKPAGTTVVLKNSEGTTLSEEDGYFSMPHDWDDWTEDKSQTPYCSTASLVFHTGGEELFPDGDYSVTLTCRDNYNTAVKTFTLRVEHGAPEIKADYSGYGGYDYPEGGETAYSDSTGASDTLPYSADNQAGESDKLFYLNGSSEFTLALSSRNALGKPWSYTLDGGAPSDIQGSELKISAKNMDEGGHTLVLTAEGLSGKQSVYTIRFTVKKSAILVGWDDLKFVTIRDGNPVLTPFRDWLSYEAGVQRYIYLPRTEKINKSTITHDSPRMSLSGPGSYTSPTKAENLWGTAFEGWCVEVTDTKGWAAGTDGANKVRFYLKITDKAHNPSEIEESAGNPGLPVRIDKTEPEIGALTLYDDEDGLQDVFDMLTFGILNPGKTKVAAEIKDIESGLKYTQYAFFLEKDLSPEGTADEAKNLTDKFFAAIQNPASAESTLKALVTENKGFMPWSTLTPLDLQDKPGYFATAAQSTPGRVLCVFRAVDQVGHESYGFKCAILDVSAPKIDIQTKSSGGVYTDDVIVHVEVSDLAEYNTSSGLKSVSYKIYTGARNGNNEPNAEPIKEEVLLTDMNLPAANSTYSFDVTLDKNINSTQVYIEVIAVDACGLVSPRTYSDYFNIDSTPPEVKVIFDTLRLTNRYLYEPKGKNYTYYNTPRNAEIQILDNNFDPTMAGELIKFASGCTGEQSNEGWTVPELGEDGRYTEPFTLQMTFKDGVHLFKIDSVSDKGQLITEVQNESYIYIKTETIDGEEKKTEVSVDDNENFIVDTSKPTCTISVERADGKQFDGEYANCPLIVTAKCGDENLGGGTLTITGPENRTYNVGANFTVELTADGRYYVTLNCSDRAGNAADPDTTTFVIDTVEPVITFDGVADQSANREEIISSVITVTDDNYAGYQVEVRLVGCATGEVYYDSSREITNGEEYTFDNIEDDDLYVLHVTAKDMAENEAEAEIQFSVNRNGSVFSLGEELSKAKEAGLEYFNDETLPPIEILETNVDTLSSVKLYLTYENENRTLTPDTDYSQTRADVNGGWSRYSYVLNPELFAKDGVYRVSLMTEDRAGNKVYKEGLYSFIKDSTPPVIVTVNLESGMTYNEENRTVTFLPKDNILMESVEVLLNGEQAGFWTGDGLSAALESGDGFSFSIPEKNSRQSVSIICTDKAGNRNENPDINNFFVTTNIFIRFFNNKPLFYGTLGGLAVAGALYFFFAKKKKNEEKKA